MLVIVYVLFGNEHMQLLIEPIPEMAFWGLYNIIN